MNRDKQVSLEQYMKSLGHIPMSGIGRPHRRLIFFKLLEELPQWFPEWLHCLHPDQQKIGVSLPPRAHQHFSQSCVFFVFLTLPVLTGRR